MLTSRVDLTLNRDFADNTWMMDDAIAHYHHGELMTPQEYEELCKWESIFGVEQHEDQFNLVFGRRKHSGMPGVEEIPWNPWYEASYSLTTYSTTHIPWVRPNIEPLHGNIEIFSLR